MAVAAPVGYSGKPLWQKLGLKEGQRLFVADPPEHLPQLLAGARARQRDYVFSENGVKFVSRS